MTWKVLITAPYFQPVADRFKPLFEAHGCEMVLPRVDERMEEEALLPLIGDIDGVICGDDRFTEAVLRAAPRLKVLSKWGTGIDSLDQEACRRLGIAIRNVPDAFSQPVADSVLGYMLTFARRLPWMDQAMKNGHWQKIPGRALGECVLGIIGVGNCGKAVARRASAFGMRILGNDPLVMPEPFLKATGIQMTDRETLLAEADFLSLNCDLNPTSFHILNAPALARMKPTAVVINAARGPLVDEPALVTALTRQGIAGAALDVFEAEPLPERSPLMTMDNVLLAPHNANSSPQAWERVHQRVMTNLFDVLEASA